MRAKFLLILAALFAVAVTTATDRHVARGEEVCEYVMCNVNTYGFSQGGQPLRGEAEMPVMATGVTAVPSNKDIQRRDTKPQLKYNTHSGLASAHIAIGYPDCSDRTAIYISLAEHRSDNLLHLLGRLNI